METDANKGMGKKHLKTIGLVVGIVLLAGLAGAGLRWYQLNQAARNAARPTAVQQKQFMSQDLAAGGDYDAAHAELNKALDNSHLSDSEKYTLTSQQATTYEAEGKYDDAIKTYRKAEALKQTQDVAESIGRTAEKAGYIELAINYYKKAKTKISSDDPIGQATAERYDAIIKNLEGRQSD